MQDNNIFKYLSSKLPDAEAKISGEANISGNVGFWQLPGGVIVVADIEKLPNTTNNIFAFHIHEGKTCENNFAETGGHYNPRSLPHPQHSGDMPPFFSNSGSAWQAFFTDRFSVQEVLGRTVIIHDGVDDFVSQPSGNSGEKIACGKIMKK